MAPFHKLFPRQFSLGVSEGLPQQFGEETRAPEVVAGNAIVQVVGTLVFFARIFSRLMIINSWKSEDSVLVAAWVFSAAYSICQYAQVGHGAGRHLSVIIQENPSDTAESQKYAFAAQMIDFPALALPKLSICLTYLRLFHADIWGRRLVKGVILIILIPLVLFSFLMVFQCKPIQVYWTEGRPASKCDTNISGVYVSGGLNVLVDISLMAIVLPRVLELHLHARQKWALVGIVGLGSFAVIAGLTRMIRVGTTLSKPNFDPTWDAYDISIWTSTEIYISLVCASAPGIKPLVARILPKLLDSTLSSRSRIKSVHLPGSIEMSLKLRRGTIGTNRVRANKHDTVLMEEEGVYDEVGRGIDRVSFNDRRSSNEENVTSIGITTTSEALTRTSVLRSPRYDISRYSPSRARIFAPFSTSTDREV